MKPARAWVLLPSGRRLNLLEPDPHAWTDEDLAIGLSRTYRWAGYSAWDLPLSVAQHSLSVLCLANRASGPRLTPREQLRELLHDATEALLGGWDPITPLKPHLGAGFAQLVELHQHAVDVRYGLPAWTADSHARHKEADALAAASEALHVAGWSLQALRDDLDIGSALLTDDPLAPTPGFREWEPWPPTYAAARFLAELRSLQAAVEPPVIPCRPSFGEAA